jgi:cytochrome c peroxidase
MDSGTFDDHKGDGLANPWLDEDVQPLALTEPEIDDLVAFLVSLTSPQHRNSANANMRAEAAQGSVD